MKSTAVANSNTALVKYWGKYNEKLILPMNGSISLTVDKLSTTTTVEFSGDYDNDIVELNGKKAEGKEASRVIEHLDLIRKLAKSTPKAKVVSKNNFLTAAGLASSASGFAALTVAGCDAVGLELNKKELSIIARQGSGSSCRSIFGGYVEWIAAKSSEKSYAKQIAGENYFDIRDIAVVVEAAKRRYTTRESMQATVKTCPFYGSWLKAVKKDLASVRRSILEKDFTMIGKVAELNSLMMHAIALTTTPTILNWSPGTISLMHAVQDWRMEGLECYYTIDTGAHVHILSLPENSREIIKRVKLINDVIDVIENRPGKGAEIVSKHLF
ncbi:MAG: diphosphomevalonate decarboxylase [Candidatus Aenigmarchaeota archaeon]|nr:diphosphomevalonate decarboxylase [Candidatus Aenigmarchaeota archaeon]